MYEVIEEYLLYHRLRNHTKATVKTEWSILKRYAEFPLHEWVKHYSHISQQRKSITNERELSRLKKFFKWCRKKDYVLRNPFSHVPRPKPEERLPKHLSREQTQTLLSAAQGVDARVHAIFSTFIHTGLRKSELFNLKPSHINLDERKLWVEAGKGRKDRVIPISRTLRPILRAWSEQRDAQHDYFFCVRDVTLRRLKQKLQDTSRLQFQMHQLRHTFAIRFLESGGSIYYLQKLMGHSSIKTTTVYLGASVEYMQKQIDATEYF